MVVFEIDQPGPQAWKRQRLEALGYGVANTLRMISVDFKADNDWWPALLEAGFDTETSAIVSSSGVSMYITKPATIDTLRRLAGLASGSTVVMTVMLPFELVNDTDRPGLEAAARGAAASGTPWVSFFTPDEIVELARDVGFATARYASTEQIAEPYLRGRRNGLSAAGGEGILIAQT